MRIAAPENSEAIAAVLAESFAEYESYYTPRAYAVTVSSVNEIRRRFGKGTTWIVSRGNRIVGTVSVAPRKDSLYIRSMAILTEARGNRIGERLLKEIEDYAVAHDYRRLFLNTTPFLKRAIRLYEKFGFVLCGSDDLFGTPLLTMENFLESGKFKKRSERIKMQYYGFDWLASVCNLLGIFLLGSRNKYGFVFCMLGSLGWLVVGIFISSVPLIFGSSIFVVLHVRGLLNWHRQSE